MGAGVTLPYFKKIIEANLLCLSKAVDPAKWVIAADFASCSYRHHWKKEDPKLRDEIKPEQMYNYNLKEKKKKWSRKQAEVKI